MPKSILVVDDDLAVTQDVCNMLNTLGYDTYSAQSTKEAFDILVRQHIQLVLLDVLLPGEPGTHLRHIIKQSPPLHGLRVVYMTAYAPTSDNNPVPFIRKPFEVEQLKKVVQQSFQSPVPNYDDELTI